MALLLTCTLFIIVISCLSCNLSNKKSDAYYDVFFSAQDKLYDEGATITANNNIDSLYGKTSSPSGYFRYKRLDFKSKFYYFQEKKDTARMYVDSSIHALETYDLTQKYPHEYAEALNAKGDYYYNADEIDKAFEYYSRSRLISKGLDNNSCAMGNQSYHLGMVTYRQEKYAEAVNYFKQAYYGISSCKKDSINYYWLQEILSNIALSYTRLEGNDSAKLYYKRTLEYLKAESPKYSYSSRQKKMAEIAEGVVMGNLAKVYMTMGITDTAEQLLQKSIAINARPGYENNDALFTNLQLAQLYHKTHRLQEAYKILLELRTALDTMPHTNVEVRWRKLMGQYYTETKQPLLANQYLQSFLQLKDSLDKAGKNLKKTDYGQLLKQQDTQYQVKLLIKDNKLKQLYLAITFGFSTIVIIISFLVFEYYRKSKKNVITLTALNHQINEQKADLQNALKDLGTSNEDKDRILRVVAHDLRTPISAIMMIGNLMTDEETDNEKIEYLEMIINASRSMISLTEELLEFSDNKNENKGEKEIIDLRDLVKQAVGLLKFKAEEKQQKIELDMPGEPVTISAYKEKINRILINLITNAIKFSPQKTDIEVLLTLKGSNVLIEVKDHGIGIPSKIINNVFDSFTTAKRHGTAGERSFGLGLSICRQIVDAHNGKIWVKSEEGKGSSFYIELPLA